MLSIVRAWHRQGRSAQWTARPREATTLVLHLASEMADLTTDPVWAAHRPALAARHDNAPLVWVRPRSTGLPVAASDLEWLERAARAYGVRALLGDRNLLGAPVGWQPYHADGDASLLVYLTALGRACESLHAELIHPWLDAALAWQLAVAGSGNGGPFYMVAGTAMRARCRQRGQTVDVDEWYALASTNDVSGIMTAWRDLAEDTHMLVRFSASDTNIGRDSLQDSNVLVDDPDDGDRLLFTRSQASATATTEKQTERPRPDGGSDTLRFDRAAGLAAPKRDPLRDAVRALRASPRAGTERVVTFHRTGTTVVLARTDAGDVIVRARVLASGADQPVLRPWLDEEELAVANALA